MGGDLQGDGRGLQTVARGAVIIFYNSFSEYNVFSMESY